MDAFEYLSVLLSIILGLAITQVLQGYRTLLLARGRVRLYGPPLIWSGLMLVLATQNWWASFGLVDHDRWTFATFGVVLLQTVLIYMMAALVLPDVPSGETVDLRAHYYREARPFFLILIATLLVSIVKDWMLDRELPEWRNLAAHGMFGALALTASLSLRPRLHELIAPVMAVVVGVYIAVLFAQL